MANLSTTRALDDVAARRGVAVERTKIGEAHVVDRMKAVGAEIGGEGNGGVIFPRVHAGRDSATGMGLILAALADPERAAGKPAGKKVAYPTLSQLNAAIPDYVMIKDKMALPDVAAARPALEKLAARLGDLASAFPGQTPRPDTTDGLKIALDDRWLHVRASGTEPILRLFAEAPTRAEGERLVAWARETIGST